MDVRAFVVEHLAKISKCKACAFFSAIFNRPGPVVAQYRGLKFSKMNIKLLLSAAYKIKMAGNGSSEVSFRQNKLVNVEYPGYVENVQHMLQSLGGEEAVSRTNEGNPARLELVFRPDDPYCHPMCGDRFPTSNLLLRVKKKRKKKKKDEAGIDEVKYEQEILGIVDTTYR